MIQIIAILAMIVFAMMSFADRGKAREIERKMREEGI